MRFDKLIRDKIPQVIEASDRLYDVEVADDIMYKKYLLEKLQEEVEEVIEEPCIDEIADVLEVLDAIKKVYGFTDEDVIAYKNKKKSARGGFEERLILKRVYEKEQG